MLTIPSNINGPTTITWSFERVNIRAHTYNEQKAEYEKKRLHHSCLIINYKPNIHYGGKCIHTLYM